MTAILGRRHRPNVASHPIAYFITFTCYGTWLHGDPRGSWREPIYGQTTKLAPNDSLRRRVADRLAADPFVMGPRERTVVAQAIEERAAAYGWPLLALNVRTNHVHVVVAAGHPPGFVLSSLKARATTMLKSAGLVSRDRRVWTRHGSTRYLWDESGVDAAVDYVLNRQGDSLPTE